MVTSLNSMSTYPVRVPAGRAHLAGDLTLPEAAKGLVIFAHGSGSSRHSPRNQYVAHVLQQAAIATLLMDLLTEEEESVDEYTAHLRFDIAMLAERLTEAADWALAQDVTGDMPQAYFGASTGAGAALVAAAARPVRIAAVVSRGGRPDLAGDALPLVQAPTLLIVGSLDEPVIEINCRAIEQMRCERRLEIVPGATHLFQEPGTLEDAARLARDWFLLYLSRSPAPRRH